MKLSIKFILIASHTQLGISKVVINMVRARLGIIISYINLNVPFQNKRDFILAVATSHLEWPLKGKLCIHLRILSIKSETTAFIGLCFLLSSSLHQENFG